MKNYIYSLMLAGGCMFASCSDFLEIEPKNRQTTSTAFVTYENFSTYSWGLYEQLDPTVGDVNGYDQYGPLAPYSLDIYSHTMVNNQQPTDNTWAYQKVTEGTLNNKWKFSYIRRVNVLLDNIEQSQMSEKDKAHWRSVGLFFRSYAYFQLLQWYGDVPWVEHVIGESDTEVIYGPRTPRDEVAANVLRDLQFAEANIKVGGDGPNTINRNVVRALLSRFGLFEGTWRKYHNLGNANTYLEASATASKALMDAVPNVNNNYDALFTNESLKNFPEVLLYFEYSDPAGLVHQAGRQAGSSGNLFELTKQGVDLYLCTDGKPIGKSELFEGDKTPYKEFRHRDHRLHCTVVPPHRLNVTGNNDKYYKRFKVGETIKIGMESLTVTVQDSIDFTENIDLMSRIAAADSKQLPAFAWNNSTTNGYAPRFRDYNDFGGSPFTGRHGYWVWKYYTQRDPKIQHSNNTTDIALFRMGEVLMNYAEAMYELERFNQEVADLTINKLRPRAGVANMVVSEINDSFDPNRDQTVPALLWEIRRERQVELMCENFSFHDIRRWKKGNYLNDLPTGCWVKNREYNNKLQIQGYPDIAASANKEGYVVYRNKPLGFMEHYYLLPVPIRDLVLNPELKQNPGYKDAGNSEK